MFLEGLLFSEGRYMNLGDGEGGEYRKKKDLNISRKLLSSYCELTQKTHCMKCLLYKYEELSWSPIPTKDRHRTMYL